MAEDTEEAMVAVAMEVDMEEDTGDMGMDMLLPTSK